MIRVASILGNLARGYAVPPGAAVDELWLTTWDAQKRRFRKRTRAGRDVAVALERPGVLADGDVLCAAESAVVVARIEAGEVVVFRLAPAPTAGALAANALRLGHVLGNQHWPVRLRHTEADPPQPAELADPAARVTGADGSSAAGAPTVELVVPLALDRRVVDAVIRAHRLQGVSYAFRPAAPDEAGGAPIAHGPHTDDHAYGHVHSPEGHHHT